jgi:hypothetical protein
VGTHSGARDRTSQLHRWPYTALQAAAHPTGVVHSGSHSPLVLCGCSQAGEFWYKMEMTAEPAAAEVLPEFRTELGKHAVQRCQLTNPLDTEAHVSITTSSPRCFVPSPTTLSLPPFSTAEFAIEYTPGSLSETEQATITASSPTAGDWEFRCSGHGELPSVMERCTVSAPVGGAGTAVIVWRNPFNEPANIRFRLEPGEAVPEQEGPSPCPFTIVTKHAARDGQLSAGPYGTVQLPVRFAPSAPEECSCCVVVEMDSGRSRQPLAWRYPVSGSAEAKGAGTRLKFRARVNAPLEETVDIMLAGLSKVGAACSGALRCISPLSGLLLEVVMRCTCT